MRKEERKEGRREERKEGRKGEREWIQESQPRGYYR
jgi:hypothetical protein